MIIFTEHALLKLKQRGIKKDLVLETLKKPERTLLSHNDREIALKKFGKLYLKVCVQARGEKYHGYYPALG